MSGLRARDGGVRAVPHNGSEDPNGGPQGKPHCARRCPMVGDFSSPIKSDRPFRMPEIFTVTLDGAMLRRGFYVYVWEITPPDGKKVLYVGRTGDSSSPNAQSLFNRLGQNLGTLATSSMVRNNLEKRCIDPTQCQFDMVGYGPIFDEVPGKHMDAHKPIRDKVGAAEKRLAEDLADAGYDVMNQVRCNAALEVEVYEQVRAAFAARFEGL